MSWGIQRVVRDYHELLADRTIPAVLIASSTDTHAMIVTDAAKAGKHISARKPWRSISPRLMTHWLPLNAAGVKLQVDSTAASIPLPPRP